MLGILRGIKIYEELQELHSGGESHVIFDVLKMISDGRDRYTIISSLYDQCKNEYYKADAIIGIEFGGAILAALMSNHLMNGKPLGFYRKDGSLILPNGEIKKVILIDDVITTGQSVNDAKNRLQWHAIEVIKVVCVVDRREIMEINE